MEIQRSLGADIVMAFDECIDARADERYVRESTARTHRWAAICRAVPLRDHQSAFGIVQGGLSEEMRRWSAQELTALDFPGYGIGGLSVGEEKSLTYSMAAVACEELPAHKARYLMGVGSPEDFVEAVAVGVDMFDCVLPTRVARNGGFLTRNGRLNVFNARFARQEDSIDPECQCPTCSRFSAAYLHHLFRAKEILGLRLATLHNLHFMFELARDARSAIVKGRYAAFLAEFRDRYRLSDQAVRATQKERWLARRAAVKGS
jgi:queuine tRNA-ribosyltransferase